MFNSHKLQKTRPWASWLFCIRGKRGRENEASPRLSVCPEKVRAGAVGILGEGELKRLGGEEVCLSSGERSLLTQPVRPGKKRAAGQRPTHRPLKGTRSSDMRRRNDNRSAQPHAKGMRRGACWVFSASSGGEGGEGGRRGRWGAHPSSSAAHREADFPRARPVPETESHAIDDIWASASPPASPHWGPGGKGLVIHWLQKKIE